MSIQECAYGGSLEFVKILAGADPKSIDEIDDQGRLALYEAAKEGHLEIVDYLLTKGAKVDKFNKSGRTALGVAADFGTSTEIVARLIEAGADPEKANKAGKTPLALAENPLSPTGNHAAILELLKTAAEAGGAKKRAAPAKKAPAAKKAKASAKPAPAKEPAEKN